MRIIYVLSTQQSSVMFYEPTIFSTEQCNERQYGTWALMIHSIHSFLACSVLVPYRLLKKHTMLVLQHIILCSHKVLQHYSLWVHKEQMKSVTTTKEKKQRETIRRTFFTIQKLFFYSLMSLQYLPVGFIHSLFNTAD